jgi:hypothetical protein
MSELVFGCVVVAMMIGTTNRQQVCTSAAGLVTRLCGLWSRQCLDHNNAGVHYCVLTCIDCGMLSHPLYQAHGCLGGHFAWKVVRACSIQNGRPKKSQLY